MDLISKNEIEKVILTRESYDELNDDLRELENEYEKLNNKIKVKTNEIYQLNIENQKLKEYIVNNMVEDLTYSLGALSKNEILDRDNICFRDNRNELKKLNIDEELFENAMIKKWNDIEINKIKLSEEKGE